jgi:hypothetical protein
MTGNMKWGVKTVLCRRGRSLKICPLRFFGESLVRSARRAMKYLAEEMLAIFIPGKDPIDIGEKRRGDVCLWARNNTGQSLLEGPVEGSGISFV